MWFVITGVLLAAIHQDFWLWDSADLLWGIMPVGLGYHALYSVTVALFWAAVVGYAWPTELDEVIPTPDAPEEPS